jgi:ABC-type transporter Mla subunit MlaD
MRRVLIVCLALAAAAAAAAVAARAGTPAAKAAKAGTFTVEVDNAFGVTSGSDVKVAGVRAGQVTGMRVDPRTTHALIDIVITQKGFGSLREDAFCETRPQSLIGEYFVDCRPGTSRRALPAGGRIPIAQTASTIPADLLGDVMRRPYRERLRILIDELGGGVGGRAGDLNDAIRRAVPALRETDRVLAILAKQNRTLAALTTNADAVIGDLAANRTDVGRFVTQTRRTAAASAERRAAIGASLRRLPAFLRELTPTMAALGQASDAQTPALRDLDASAGQLTRLLENVPPFSKASRTGLRTLADASRTGRPALKAAKPTIAQLGQAVAHMPEVANNLAIVLEHLGDRTFAVEKDPRSPGGQGYTGLEAILQYVFDQSMAINIYDANSHILKVDLFASKCSDYQNLDSLKAKMQQDPSFFSDCAAVLGPNLTGITQPDPTATRASSASKTKPDRTPAPAPADRSLVSTGTPPAEPNAKDTTKAALRRERRKRRRAAEELRKRIEQTLGINLPDVPQTAAPPLPSAGQAAPQVPSTADPQQLLDFLLGP